MSNATTPTDYMTVGTLVTGFYVIDRSQRINDQRCARVFPVFPSRGQVHGWQAQHQGPSHREYVEVGRAS
jgi:hypothetical protein